jgi:hypothetical protein
LSILDPGNIDFTDYTAETRSGKAFSNDELARINVEGKQPTRGDVDRPDSEQLARTPLTSPDLDSSQVTNNSRQVIPGVPNSRLPLTNKTAALTPMLFGNSDSKQLAGSFIQDSNKPSSPTNTGVTKSPGQKLIEAVANTNPSPQSFWKRTLSGLGRGLGQAAGDFAEGEYGTAFGKIASNTVLNLIPGVDSATQYERNVSQAKRTYDIESQVAKDDLQRRKTEADIVETNERLKLAGDQKRAQLDRATQDQLARLRDDKRADANQQLMILRELPADDPQRNEIAKELATKFQVRVSPRYGLKESGADEITIYDEQSGNYIRASKDGTPKLDASGNTIIVRPGRQQSITQRKTEAMQKVIAKYGGDAKSVARLSTENRKEEIINSLHPDYARALRQPSGVNAMVLDEANKAYATAFDRMLKQNEAFTEALYERETSELLNAVPQSNKQPTPPTNKGKQSAGEKVPSSVRPGYFLK